MTLADVLLRPRSVAIVGASDDLAKTSSRPLNYLRRAQFAGRLMPVNARRETVLGMDAWPSIAALPETPEHVFVLSPSDSVVDIVRECSARGVPIVTVLAGGFGEGGGNEEPHRRAALHAALSGGRTRLLGPNSIGLVNTRNGLALTANAAFAETGLPVGGLFVASHSGSMIGALVSRGKAKGVGFAGLISTGAELDLSLGEVCEATLDDPGIDCYALFLETLNHGHAIRRFAHAAAARGKPIVAYKLGRSAQAAELSQSHTGAIAGEDGIADAFLKDCGIARVETLEALLESPALLRRLPTVPPRGMRPKAAVVTTTGGAAAMVVDQLGIRGIEVVAPSAETAKRLANRGVDAAPGRIVDLTLAGTRPSVMRAALDTLLESPEFNIVIAVAGSSARFQPELLVPAITGAAAVGEKPLVAFVAPEAPEALASLVAANVPCFHTPEACGDAIAAAYARRPAHAPLIRPSNIGEWQLDEAEGYALLAELSISAAAFEVIAADTARTALDYPVALKILSSEVLHKTEIGGVHLGIADEVDLRQAAKAIVADVRQGEPWLKVDRLLVQEMTTGVGEVLLSFRDDSEAGPMVMLAAGGILAELHGDHSLRLAPVDLLEAKAMIAEVKALRSLDGYRGKPLGDLDALADAIVAISHAGSHVVEAEINPLVVRREGEGVVAIDAVVRVRELP